MPDPATTAAATGDLLTGGLTTILNFIAAAGGLGTAAMGLVDTLKSRDGGGPSSVGFSDIETALAPFLVEPSAQARSGGTTVPTVLSKQKILATLKANWLNGVDKAEQKAKAKSLIHLGLTQGNAAALAGAAGVDQTKMLSVAQKVATGTALAPDEVNVLGQFEAVVSAVLDEAYERADQRYRNGTKLRATIIATVLAVIGGWVLYGISWQLALSFLVGLSATPLAPIAKDLASSLQAASKAVGTVKG